jgi:AcrR family transcriptional regulator
VATQEERHRATRSRIVTAAHRLFVRDGVEATSTEAILTEAGISRGALYHHFASKQDVFAAVYDLEAAGAIERAMARVRPTGSAMETLIRTCLAWLREARKPEVGRLLLQDGPAVLGIQQCREIEARHSLGRMMAAIEAARDAGEMKVASVELTARVLNATLGELAVVLAEDRRRKTLAEADAIVRHMVEGLHPKPTSGSELGARLQRQLPGLNPPQAG